MSTLREMAEEVSKKLDDEADFFLVVKPKLADPQTGLKRSLVATNVGRRQIHDMVVEGSSAWIMDQVFKARYGEGESNG